MLNYEPITLSTDMWSVGVLTYVLLSGYSPFGGDSKQETYLNITQAQLDFPPKLFDDVSQSAIDFITALLQRKPNDRLNSNQASEHVWLQSEVGNEEKKPPNPINQQKETIRTDVASNLTTKPPKDSQPNDKFIKIQDEGVGVTTHDTQNDCSCDVTKNDKTSLLVAVQTNNLPTPSDEVASEKSIEQGQAIKSMGADGAQKKTPDEIDPTQLAVSDSECGRNEKIVIFIDQTVIEGTLKKPIKPNADFGGLENVEPKKKRTFSNPIDAIVTSEAMERNESADQRQSSEQPIKFIHEIHKTSDPESILCKDSENEFSKDCTDQCANMDIVKESSENVEFSSHSTSDSPELCSIEQQQMSDQQSPVELSNTVCSILGSVLNSVSSDSLNNSSSKGNPIMNAVACAL